MKGKKDKSEALNARRDPEYARLLLGADSVMYVLVKFQPKQP